MKRVFTHELFRRSVLFSMSIVASTVVGVFSIPVLVASVGAAQWGALAVMQVIGQFFAVFVAFGWGATGPSMVSAAPYAQRKAMFTESLSFRFVLLLCAAPLTVVLCVLLPGESWLNASLAMLSYVVPGLSAAWYFVGTNRPVALFFFDALPVILGQVAGLIAVLTWGGITAYLACTSLAAVLGVLASSIYIFTRVSDGAVRATARTSWGRILREQGPGVTSTISASLWTAAPMTLVQAFAPQSVPVFAMVDRLMKYGVLALAPILQAVQGWVPESGSRNLTDRARTSIRIAVVVGAIGGAGLALLSTPVSSLLTLGEATVPWVLSAIAGMALMAECVSQVAGLSALVALGGARQLATSSIASAVLGIPVIAVLIFAWGIYGAVLGILLVASALAIYRTWHARRLAAAIDSATSTDGD